MSEETAETTEETEDGAGIGELLDDLGLHLNAFHEKHGETQDVSQLREDSDPITVSSVLVRGAPSRSHHKPGQKELADADAAKDAG